jgi:hypothetical protein
MIIKVGDNMTFQILSNEESKGLSCCFEQWDKTKKNMGTCGIQPIASMGDKFLCCEHIPDALIRTGQVSLKDKKTNKKHVPCMTFAFKEDFLNACKKE